MSTTFQTIASPLGELLVVADGDGLTDLILPGEDTLSPADATQGGAIVDGVVKQLEAWFAGKRTDFDVPLAPRGTDFQQGVWRALCDVPFGATATYGEIAQAVGRPTATRAVGAANGRNPIPIIIPCHRVIGANGALTGYSGGGGLVTKRWLLDHEHGVTRLIA